MCSTTGVRFSATTRFFFAPISSPAERTTETNCTGSHFPGGKSPQRKTDHSPLLLSRLRMCEALTPLTPLAVITWCLNAGTLYRSHYFILISSVINTGSKLFYINIDKRCKILHKFPHICCVCHRNHLFTVYSSYIKCLEQ
jgi:hypothetical protein